MKLAETGFTADEIKAKAKKYMIETYERFDFVADSAKGVYLYDEKETPYLDLFLALWSALWRTQSSARTTLFRKKSFLDFSREFARFTLSFSEERL